MKPGLRVVRGRDWIINMNDPDGNGFGLTPLFGDRRGFMPPQLKKKKNRLKWSRYISSSKSHSISFMGSEMGQD
jgi:hypothetical protein